MKPMRYAHNDGHTDLCYDDSGRFVRISIVPVDILIAFAKRKILLDFFTKLFRLLQLTLIEVKHERSRRTNN